MTTTTDPIDALDQSIANAVARDAIAASRPSPDQIDAEAAFFIKLKADATEAAEDAREQEEKLVAMVQAWGTVPPNAEKSRRLSGRLAELTVTKSDTLSINSDRVTDLRDALEANGHADFFSRLFAPQTKYEIVDGAESALRQFALPKRLAEKVLNLFGRCITVRPKKPSLKVTFANPEKPARKPRAKKAAAE